MRITNAKLLINAERAFTNTYIPRVADCNPVRRASTFFPIIHAPLTGSLSLSLSFAD